MIININIKLHGRGSFAKLVRSSHFVYSHHLYIHATQMIRCYEKNKYSERFRNIFDISAALSRVVSNKKKRQRNFEKIIY